MSSGGPGVPGLVPVVRDDAYTRSRHTLGGSAVAKDLARGREAHVFEPDVDLDLLEHKVWTEGTHQGRVGAGSRAWFDRFLWRSPTPIGRRVQVGKPDLPLHWVEIKGRMNAGAWVYHLAPRTRPAA